MMKASVGKEVINLHQMGETRPFYDNSIPLLHFFFWCPGRYMQAWRRDCRWNIQQLPDLELSDVFHLQTKKHTHLFEQTLETAPGCERMMCVNQ